MPEEDARRWCRRPWRAPARHAASRRKSAEKVDKRKQQRKGRTDYSRLFSGFPWGALLSRPVLRSRMTHSTEYLALLSLSLSLSFFPRSFTRSLLFCLVFLPGFTFLYSRAASVLPFPEPFFSPPTSVPSFLPSVAWVRANGGER